MNISTAVKICIVIRTIFYTLKALSMKFCGILQGMLSYRIPSRISWGRLFSVMEALKNGRQPSDRDTDVVASPVANLQESIVEDYAASDTSLEQVFLTFAREASGENQNKHIPQEVVTKL